MENFYHLGSYQGRYISPLESLQTKNKFFFLVEFIKGDNQEQSRERIWVQLYFKSLN